MVFLLFLQISWHQSSHAMLCNKTGFIKGQDPLLGFSYMVPIAVTVKHCAVPSLPLYVALIQQVHNRYIATSMFPWKVKVAHCKKCMKRYKSYLNRKFSHYIMRGKNVLWSWMKNRIYTQGSIYFMHL